MKYVFQSNISCMYSFTYVFFWEGGGGGAIGTKERTYVTFKELLNKLNNSRHVFIPSCLAFVEFSSLTNNQVQGMEMATMIVCI